jgi:hypothetical protein
MKPLHLLALATALALSSTPMALANDTNFILRLSPNGTLTWPAPTAGADRYHVQSSGTLLDWAGVPGLTNIFPTATTQGRFSFALPGFSGTVATQSFYRVLAEGLAGETCPGAELLSFPVAVQHTTVGYRDDANAYLSLPSLPGPDRHYRLRLPGQWLLTATLMPAAGFDPALVLFSATNCGATPLPALAAADASGAGGGETLLWSNATPAIVDVILAVDSAGTSGTYALELAAESLLPGDSPFVPQSLPGAGIYLGTTVGYANDITSGLLCQGTAGPDRFYRITLSAGQRLQASVEPTANFDPSINLLRPPTVGQTVFDCVAGDDSGSLSTRNQVLFNNPGLGSEDVLIAIDTYTATFGGGPYRLEVQLGTFPAGDVPRKAQILAGPGTVTGNLTDYVNDLTSYPGWINLRGRDRFYRVAVPAGQRMVTTLTPTGFNAALAVLDATALDATNLVLLAAADASPSTSGAETAAWFNATGTNRDVILAVDTDIPSALGSFTLAVQFNVPPVGDVPPTAELLAGPGTVSGTTVGFLNDALLYPGLVNQPGNDRFYRLTVPAGLRLAATMSNVSFNASIVVLDAGAAAGGTLEVLAFADDSTSLTGAEKVFWRNAAATNREVVIAVESPAAGAGGDFTLTTDVAEVPPGETPLTAELLAGAGTVTGTINGHANDLLTYPAWQSLPGPDHFFRVTVPAGERLVASLTPSGFDAALGLLDASPMDASNAVVVLAAANNSFGPTGVGSSGIIVGRD